MFSNSSKWFGVTLLVGGLGVCLAAKVVLAQQISPYGTCDGKVTQYTPPWTPGSQFAPLPRYPRLECTPVSCSPGCAQMQVTTAFGPGMICVCNYIGPQPFCCTIAFPGLMHITPFGDCGGPCPAGTTCASQQWTTYNEGGSTVYNWTAHCVDVVN